jgi:hypothetical protein
MLLMDQTRVLTANFVEDMATNGTPKRWIAAVYGTNDFDGDAMSDTDGDLMRAWQEYRADTDPTNELSVLRLLRLGESSPHSITWSSVPTRFYSLYRSTNLLLPWLDAPIAINIAGHASGTNTFIDVTSTNFPGAYYKVGVQYP